MSASVLLSLAASFLSGGAPARAYSAPAFDKTLQPTVQCIYRALRSNKQVRSVSLYSVDDVRFAVEYSFRDKENRLVFSDIEFLGYEVPFTATDKVPREVSVETDNEAQELESNMSLNSKCGLRYAFDNLYPEASARSEWVKVDWPWEHRPSK